MTPGRLELKYCVPEWVAASVVDLAREHLVPDPLAKGPRQRVTSLYFDTADLQFLRWHREHASDRFKLRIRRYGEEPAQTLYSEIKRKTSSVVRKRRTPFPIEYLPTAIDVSRAALGAEPRVIVTGVREALRDPAGEEAVTVDRMLRYQPMREADLDGRPAAWHDLPLPCCTTPDRVLLELKYGVEPPVWMLPLIAALAPARVSFSKYAAAMGEPVSALPMAASVRCEPPVRLALV